MFAMSVPINTVIFAQYGYVCGDEAACFIQASVEVAEKRRNWIASAYRKIGDIERTARLSAEQFQDEGNFNLVPHEVFVAAQRTMLKHVLSKN